ncbi:hypothetical protein BN6_61910 [Saccharothrix espanaensis DSM 44229]|uniref:Tc1-like transposase DDE domain-containing protein n=1 Tax=Saccharothrix espanaensis (strain ATCC 51144 / DSM 44229 / JCM 9112 / NBRC 15066 / NRRL 15764) TaxID=1179773 RepID=K0K7C0_SACES|nr:transposase [Saccharothrix espanaensis]CCH33442.1 hypothetical protein BN6_61910 [Saccharothrix espanaensis DSM 44229]
MATAQARPARAGLPSTRWSLRKLAAHLHHNPDRRVRIGRERPRQILREHGISYFHGCHSIGDDRLRGVTRRRKGGDHSQASLKSIRAARPDGAPIHVIMDNLSANTTPKILTWAVDNNVEICPTPTYASWANPIEPQFGPLRTFLIANSVHPNHPVPAGELQRHLRWCNANARHPDNLHAQRRERARIRSEHHQRWGRPRPQAA